MKYLLMISVWFLSLSAVSQINGRLTTDSVAGIYIIDLRPTPNSQPYLK